MKKFDKENKDFPTKKTDQKYKKPLQQYGGVYFYCGAIIGRKNVFVTDEYINLLAGAFHSAELKKDVKNLGYVVMPNFFYWMFRLSEKNDDPVAVYAELKKDVAVGILNNLRDEVRDGSFEMAEIFKGNEKVGRSKPEKILWTFEMFAKEFENNKRHRVWAPKTEIRLIDNDELLQQKLKVIKSAPVSERWQLTEKLEDYPYVYLADEVANMQEESVNLAGLLPTLGVQQAMA